MNNEASAARAHGPTNTVPGSPLPINPIAAHKRRKPSLSSADLLLFLSAMLLFAAKPATESTELDSTSILLRGPKLMLGWIGGLRFSHAPDPGLWLNRPENTSTVGQGCNDARPSRTDPAKVAASADDRIRAEALRQLRALDLDSLDSRFESLDDLLGDGWDFATEDSSILPPNGDSS